MAISIGVEAWKPHYSRDATQRRPSSSRQAAFVADKLGKHGEILVPMPISQAAFGDPDDLPMLGTAVAGNVDCLITGDKRLLTLGQYEGIPILSPRGFYDRIRASE
jgi:predicted nucleic acid-binding protein